MGPLIPKEFEAAMQKAVEEAGTERLTPMKELLPEEIEFFMIRAFLQSGSVQKLKIN